MLFMSVKEYQEYKRRKRHEPRHCREVIMNGFFYRLGESIREAGERAGHKRHWYAGVVVRLGFFIRDIRMTAWAK
jgi:hypothetical protein